MDLKKLVYISVNKFFPLISKVLKGAVSSTPHRVLAVVVCSDDNAAQ